MPRPTLGGSLPSETTPSLPTLSQNQRLNAKALAAPEHCPAFKLLKVCDSGDVLTFFMF